MFEKNGHTAEAVEKLWTAFGSAERGSTITWDKIEATMGCCRTDVGGWHIVRQFRKRMLRERQIVTLPADTVGIRLLTHTEAAREIPALRQRKAYRQINRCLRETATVEGSELSDHDRLVLSMQRHNLRAERLQLGRSRRELAKAMDAKKTEVNPIRKEAGRKETVAAG